MKMSRREPRAEALRLGLRKTRGLLGLKVCLMTEFGYVGWCEEALATVAGEKDRVVQSGRRLRGQSCSDPARPASSSDRSP
jgi:hypothetical protein